MPKPWYSIKAAAAEGEPAEISILDVISSWYGVNAMSFLTEFRALKATAVKVFINSPGGSVVEALAMFNGMRASGKKIEVHVLGIAASAASYIAMAGDKIVMPRNTMMLPHKPMNGEGGNADEHRATADMLDTVEGLLLPAYMARFKGTEAELKALLAKDELLTAEQCLEYGFCDEVVDEVTATAEFDVEMLPPAARIMFEAVKAPVVAPVAPAPVVALETLSETVASLAKDAGLEAHADIFVTDSSITSLETAATVIAQAREIAALAKYSGRPDSAAALIRGRKTIAEARASLASELAEADAALHVDTSAPSKSLQSPQPAVNWNPTTLWADIHAMKTGSKK